MGKFEKKPDGHRIRLRRLLAAIAVGLLCAAALLLAVLLQQGLL